MVPRLSQAPDGGLTIQSDRARVITPFRLGSFLRRIRSTSAVAESFRRLETATLTLYEPLNTPPPVLYLWGRRSAALSAGGDQSSPAVEVSTIPSLRLGWEHLESFFPLVDKLISDFDMALPA